MNNGLLFAYLLDGKGGARELDWDGVREWKPENGTIWIHLDRTNENVQGWLENHLGLDEIVCEALLAEDTRPRIMAIDEGLLLILRGVNLNEDSVPEDMIAVRMWCTKNMVITLRKFKLFTITEIKDTLLKGKGPEDTGDLISAMMDGLVERIGHTLEEIDEGMDDMEQRINQTHHRTLRLELGDVRRKAVIMRRYLIPQRDVFSRLQVDKNEWISSYHRSCFREAADKLTRCIEDLDMLKERSLVAMDLLETYLSERMNKTMYWLTIFSAVFLPLTFFTGLLGINVGGIPFADSVYGFGIVCVILVMMSALQIVLFRLLKIF